MHHRGPDAQGTYRSETEAGKKLLLLHSRLAIIDLDERAKQPLRIGDMLMTYNGELYNYIELRAELKKMGSQFSTLSDTEVFLEVLRAYGPEGLDKCEGMWAFGAYDEYRQELILGRDRFGEKPLYIYEDATGLYFGSEVKFISALSGVRFDINHRQLYRYLVNGYKSLYKKGATFFFGITELPPGHIFFIRPDGTQEQRAYWQPQFYENESMSYEDAVDGTRESLVRAVTLRLRADVPMAFCMSGGVDSNTLISIAKKVCNYDVHGFTIVNTDERYAEQDLVDDAVLRLDIRHSAVPVNTDRFLDRLRELVRFHDAPVYTVSYYAQWLLMENIAEQGYKISISGTAADELFTGYYDHHLMYLYEIKQDEPLFNHALQSWNDNILPIVRNPLLQDPYAFVKNPNQREHIYLDASFFSDCLKIDFEEPFEEKCFVDGLLRNRMLNEMFHESVPVILHEDDLNAMYYSIENRSPFLDRQLFEFCYSIPTRHLIGNGFNKKVLRDAMRGIVPASILESRRKVGFNAPILSFLDIHDRNVYEYLLDDSPVFEFVRKNRIEDILAEDYLTNSKSKFLFSFVCSKMFLEEYAASAVEESV